MTECRNWRMYGSGTAPPGSISPVAWKSAASTTAPSSTPSAKLHSAWLPSSFSRIQPGRPGAGGAAGCGAGFENGEEDEAKKDENGDVAEEDGLERVLT